MPICKACSREVEDSDRFCYECGLPLPPKEGDVLHMQSYYGAISWQILSIYIAIVLVVAFIPLGIPSRRIPFALFIVNEVIAMGLMAVGVTFWSRYQALAHRWIHNEYWDLENWISNIEWGRPYRAPHPVPSPQSFPASALMIMTALLAIAYVVLIVSVFLVT